MAIRYRSFSVVTTKTTTSNGSLTLNAPGSVVTNDLLVACISFRGATTPSIPAGWQIINRTTVTGNTATNNTSIGSGLMAWTKVTGTVNYVFGATTGEQFPNLAFGSVLRFDGQDLTDPVAGTSVNTIATGILSGEVTTGGYTRSFQTQTSEDYYEIMLFMGGQESFGSGSSNYQYITNLVGFGEVLQATNTAGADGSMAIAVRGFPLTPLGDTTGGFRVDCNLNNVSRSSLMVASFGGPRPPSVGYSFFTLF